jgi:hypothetical protein
MEHSLHLAAKHFVQTIAPHSSRKADNPGTDTEDDHVSDNGEDDDDDGDDVDAGDSLGKAIALVKQVSFSRPYCYIFCINECATDSQIAAGKGILPCNLHPSRDHPTRTSSVDSYSMGIPLRFP